MKKIKRETFRGTTTEFDIGCKCRKKLESAAQSVVGTVYACIMMDLDIAVFLNQADLKSRIVVWLDQSMADTIEFDFEQQIVRGFEMLEGSDPDIKENIEGLKKMVVRLEKRFIKKDASNV